MDNTGIFKHLHFSHPTKEQADVLKEMEEFIDDSNQFDFIVLCGAAGTGKTSIKTRTKPEFEKAGSKPGLNMV